MNIETTPTYFEIYSYCPTEDEMTIKIITEPVTVITNEELNED